MVLQQAEAGPAHHYVLEGDTTLVLDPGENIPDFAATPLVAYAQGSGFYLGLYKVLAVGSSRHFTQFKQRNHFRVANDS